MKNAYIVKYQYALDQENTVVHISDCETDKDIRSKRFTCLSCGSALIPVLGQVRKKHFRHALSVVCNPETYLHNLAKVYFYQTYQNCLTSGKPFNIALSKIKRCSFCENNFGISCDIKPELISYDLTKYYPLISLEKFIDGYKPDVLLSNTTGNNLFIEFVVTHFSTIEKINSGAKIIELLINDESDLKAISDCYLSKENRSISFFNFKELVLNVDLSKNCPNKFFFFILYKNGRAIIYHNSPIQILKLIEKGSVTYYKKLEYFRRGVYIRELIFAYKANHLVKNCFLCRYHAVNHYFFDDDEKPIFCKFLYEEKISTFAVDCKYYKADPKAFPILY